MCSSKDKYKNGLNSLKLEITQMSFNWIKDKLWYAHTMKHYSAIKKKLLLHMRMQIYLIKYHVEQEKSDTKHTPWFYLYQVQKKTELIIYGDEGQNSGL